MISRVIRFGRRQLRRRWVLGLSIALALAAIGLIVVRPFATRYVPFTFTVNSTADGSDANLADGICQTSTRGQCTLRAAIEQANARGGRDTITFNIRGIGGHTIAPAFLALPTITQPVVIDGYTQPSATPNTSPPGSPSNAVLRIRAQRRGRRPLR